MDKGQTITLAEISERFKAASEDFFRLNYYVRDSDLQKEQIDKTSELIALIRGVKVQVVQRRQEKAANSLFRLQCLLNSFNSSLKMWLSVKNSDFVAAWGFVIDSQEYAQVALKIEPKDSGISEYLRSLTQIERSLFPMWPGYMSSALIESCGKCSICGKEYSDCEEHLEGLVYWGRLCRRVGRKPVRLDHAAFVESPRDRRCIIRYISTDEGKKRDYITWKVLDEVFEKGTSSDRLTMSGVLLSYHQLDLD